MRLKRSGTQFLADADDVSLVDVGLTVSFTTETLCIDQGSHGGSLLTPMFLLIFLFYRPGKCCRHFACWCCLHLQDQITMSKESINRFYNISVVNRLSLLVQPSPGGLLNHSLYIHQCMKPPHWHPEHDAAGGSETYATVIKSIRCQGPTVTVLGKFFCQLVPVSERNVLIGLCILSVYFYWLWQQNQITCKVVCPFPHAELRNCVFLERIRPLGPPLWSSGQSSWQ
jgi:hypothetical protein